MNYPSRAVTEFKIFTGEILRAEPKTHCKNA